MPLLRQHQSTKCFIGAWRKCTREGATLQPDMQKTLFDVAGGIQENDWFLQILEALQVADAPCWPDRFGRAIHACISAAATPVRTLSLFSGGGGLDIAFHDAGFEIVEMVEVEAKYAQTLCANSMPGGYLAGAQVVCKDIREYYPPHDMQVDFIIGGPPCQTFSAAGRRAAGVRGTTDPRGTLFHEYVRLLHRLQPTGFLFENVYGITGAEQGEPWAEIQAAFRDAGYTISHRILDAADFGVPQHRERLFIVGLREGMFQFPRPTHGPDSPGKHLFYTASEAIAGLGNDEGLAAIGGRFGSLLNDIPPGLNYSFYTKEMGYPSPIFSWRSKFSDYLYKADPEAPVRTLKAQVGAYSGPFHWENRPFTIAEHKRLQTFPDDYQLRGGRQVCIQQIGNSVPPQVGRMLALSILNQVFGVKLPFPMHYMPEGLALGFRQRKRQLTQKYAAKAAEALCLLFPANAATASTSSLPILDETATRYISDDFTWQAAHVNGSTCIYLRNTFDNETWHIQGVSSGGEASTPRYKITITPAPASEWPLVQREVSLEGADWTPLLYTGLWKAFEEALYTAYGVADLVQLFGYYQYPSKVQVAFSCSNLNEPFASLLWSVLPCIIQKVGVAVQYTAAELAALWGLQKLEIFPLLKELRVIGYEVRSHNTNPQIKEGVFLIPYAFPTLTPRSVQLRKKI